MVRTRSDIKKAAAAMKEAPKRAREEGVVSDVVGPGHVVCVFQFGKAPHRTYTIKVTEIEEDGEDMCGVLHDTLFNLLYHSHTLEEEQIIHMTCLPVTGDEFTYAQLRLMFVRLPGGGREAGLRVAQLLEEGWCILQREPTIDDWKDSVFVSMLRKRLVYLE